MACQYIQGQWHYTLQPRWAPLPFCPFHLGQCPLYVWLLCGVNGSCTDLSPLSQVAGGAWDNANFIGMVLMCLKRLYFNLLEGGMFLFRLCLFVCDLLLCLLFIRSLASGLMGALGCMLVIVCVCCVFGACVRCSVCRPALLPWWRKPLPQWRQDNLLRFGLLL